MVCFRFFKPNTVTRSKRDLENCKSEDSGIMSSHVQGLAELVPERGGHEEGSGSLAEEARLGSVQRTRQLGSAELVPERGGDEEGTGSLAEEARLGSFQRTRQLGSA